MGVLVNYYDRVNLTVSHEALIAAFHLRESTFGFLLSAYSYTYALCQLPTGVLLDRFGVRRVSLVSIALWGVASLAAAVAPGLLFFFAARLLLGVGEAPTFPANAKAVGAWFPDAERSMATAIFDSAAKLANATGVPLLGFLLLHIGWRMSFGVTAALSFGFLALFALLYRERSAQTSAQDLAAGNLGTRDIGAAAAAAIPLTRLLRERKVLGLALGYGAYNYVFYLLLTYLPKFLSAQLGIQAMRSFLFTGLPWLVAFVAEMLIGGLLVERLIRRGVNASTVRRVVLVAGSTCGFALFAAAFAHTLPAALIAISVAIGGLAAAAPVHWAVTSLLVPNTSTGRVAAIGNFAGQISAIVAPVVTALLYERTHSFVLPFAVAAAYLCLGVFGYGVLLGRIEPIDVRG